MVHLRRVLLAKARGRASRLFRGRVSRLFVSLSQQPSSPKPYPRQEFPEEPDEYTHGGYHPVSLGDKFECKRYTILRKLGYGEYSTVWLARDLRLERYVAIKVLRADSYGGHQPIFECEILAKIQEMSQKSSHEGQKCILPLLEKFTHRGPNGLHVCLVFDVLGYHLDFQAAKHKDERLPVKAVKEIVRQLLTGLDFLHTECGVIHTDLKSTNILMELENPSDTVSKYLESVPPRTTRGQSGAIIPLREVIKTPLVSEVASLRVRIIDFGVASWREKHLSDELQPLSLRAPEVTIGATWDTGVDIWSLGCLFVQGIVLFSGEASERGTWSAEDEHLARIVKVLGPFPSSLLKKGRRSAELFDEKGRLVRGPSLERSSLECILNGSVKPYKRPSDMSKKEFDVFVDFLKGMLEIDPSKRKSAAQLLQHEWLS
ncbi:hypothetical protein E4U14_004700 [Claviceps sp. LM454 group G7]|nr:hypothetical protein E4U14_004700 [Claviceps sp. LM454 group G7]